MTAIISKNATAILEKRYLNNGESIEQMFRRVSLGNEDYFRLMSDLEFLPNSPTLFNCGLNNGCTLSACFVFNVEDTMFEHADSIVNVRNKAIGVAKAGGGVGYYFGKLRKKNSLIKSIHRKACGPVAVLKDYHGVRSLVTQGGKRDLAQMGVLNCDNPDIEEFIHSKDDDPKSLESFNLSVSWTDKWLSKVDFNAWGSPEQTNKETWLWMEQCRSAWKTGCPGMFFHDTVNRFNFNKHIGVIYAPNPCGETPNRSNEPCHLGSLALMRFVILKTRQFDLQRLYERACLSTRFLDDLFDINTFPHPDITAASFLTRKLGLGVMGWADTLALMGIEYGSEESLKLADQVMSTIAKASRDTRKKLAKEKGPYKGYSDRAEDECYRNETGTSIAPTGTIGLIAGVWGGIEPYFAFDVDRVTNEGMKLDDGISDHVKRHLDGHVPKVANEVSLEAHVRMQAAFQKHTDLGVSKTINLPKSATVQDVSNAYRMMWQMGCKGGTIYRDGCRDEQVLRAKPKKSVYSSGTDLNGERSMKNDVVSAYDGDGIVVTPKGERRKLEDRHASVTHKFYVGEVSGFLTVGLYDDGKPGEIFLRFSRVGSTVSGLLDSWAMAISLALQHGTPLDRLVRLYAGTRFDPCGMTKNKAIPVCSSIPDYVMRWLELEFLKPKEKSDSAVMSGQYCPDCQAELVYVAGCLSCIKQGCGFQRCG